MVRLFRDAAIGKAVIDALHSRAAERRHDEHLVLTLVKGPLGRESGPRFVLNPEIARTFMDHPDRKPFILEILLHLARNQLPPLPHLKLLHGLHDYLPSDSMEALEKCNMRLHQEKEVVVGHLFDRTPASYNVKDIAIQLGLFACRTGANDGHIVRSGPCGAFGVASRLDESEPPLGLFVAIRPGTAWPPRFVYIFTQDGMREMRSPDLARYLRNGVEDATPGSDSHIQSLRLFRLFETVIRSALAPQRSP